MAAERRRFERLMVPWMVQVGAYPKLCMVWDISPGGIFVCGAFAQDAWLTCPLVVHALGPANKKLNLRAQGIRIYQRPPGAWGGKPAGLGFAFDQPLAHPFFAQELN